MTSRFNVVQAPPLSPGHCWITKTSVGPFIDTGIDLSLDKIDRGRIYISVDALREMAQVAGLFDEKEPVTVELKRKQWYDQGYNDAMKEMSGDAINRFIEHISSGSVGFAGGAAVVEPKVHHTAAGAAVPSVEDSTAGASESIEDDGGFERKSSSTGRFKRSARVPADSSNESDFRL